MAPKPKSIIAQLAGSGTAPVLMKVKLSANTELPETLGERDPNMANAMLEPDKVSVNSVESEAEAASDVNPSDVAPPSKSSRNSKSGSAPKSPRSTDTVPVSADMKSALSSEKAPDEKVARRPVVLLGVVGKVNVLVGDTVEKVTPETV